MRTRMSNKGEVVVPAKLRDQDDLHPGQVFEFQRIAAGDYRLVRRRSHPVSGLVDWLLECPEKGFFVPVVSESTDEL